MAYNKINFVQTTLFVISLFQQRKFKCEIPETRSILAGIVESGGKLFKRTVMLNFEKPKSEKKAHFKKVVIINVP